MGEVLSRPPPGPRRVPLNGLRGNLKREKERDQGQKKIKSFSLLFGKGRGREEPDKGGTPNRLFPGAVRDSSNRLRRTSPSRPRPPRPAPRGGSRDGPTRAGDAPRGGAQGPGPSDAKPVSSLNRSESQNPALSTLCPGWGE